MKFPVHCNCTFVVGAYVHIFTGSLQRSTIFDKFVHLTVRVYLVNLPSNWLQLAGFRNEFPNQLLYVPHHFRIDCLWAS